MCQFEIIKKTEMKTSESKVHSKDENFSKKLLTQRSLSAISLQCTGQELGREVSKWLSLNLKEDLKYLLNDAGKLMRRVRDHRLCLSHIQQAIRMDENLSINILYRLVPREDRLGQSAVKVPILEGEAITCDPGLLERVTVQDSEPEISSWPASPSFTGWIKLEQVFLKSCKRYPLTKEQQSFYELVTEACVGTSESRRQRALQTLATDPSLEVLLPSLSKFIADAVSVNVTQQNLPLLLYVMRMVRAILGNRRLSFLPYLHMILPAVLSCLLTKHACSSAGSDDHWALREYSGNVMAQIVRHFDASDNSILPRVIGIYKKALKMQPLTTVFGAVIGLGKLGNHAVRACILPQIGFLSERIEPYLSVSNGCSSSSLDKLAAKYIRHRLVKMCTPVLKSIHSTPDLPKEYADAYGFLGPQLCGAVIVARVKAEAVAAAKKEADEASKNKQTKRSGEPYNQSKISGAVCVGSKVLVSTNSLMNGVCRPNDVALTLKINPKTQMKNQAVSVKPVEHMVAQPTQVQLPKYSGTLVPPISKQFRALPPKKSILIITS
ncbi:transcription initiation factor TFIID subunit 6 [Drosophila ficusphila]|uniref:transcription initiation factor TFIID subunit 6 n=1 Tax=Drosophila ficusphila TaxID=30025 RepID=UPI0007E66E8A|nr:transcription initiation factor TFIID subunit 6 [Drosophila ficusphila]